MRTRTWFVGLSAGAALLAGGSVTTAQAAPAGGEPPSWTPSGVQSCSSHSHRDIDPGGGETVSTQTLRRSGPHNTCGSNPVHSTAVNYHCYTTNESGNTWTYLTVRSTGAEGWVYDGNLTNGGSTYPC
ncbi:SH3 domain-containing protein [Streptomyces sp. NPDC018029]|uniref:SH3 domain-containing protein n=1 Tax=Streptomyces sp. NPDC018029 TaxID=3365032 RepID=UPI0037B4EE4B